MILGYAGRFIVIPEYLNIVKGKSKKKNVNIKAESRRSCPNALRMEGGNCKPRNSGGLLSWKRKLKGLAPKKNHRVLEKHI